MTNNNYRKTDKINTLTPSEIEELYIQQKIDFASIPTDKRTAKTWYLAVLVGDISALELPSELQNQAFYQLYFERVLDIRQIAPKFQTQAMADKDFEIHHDIIRIPNQFQTKEMAIQDLELYHKPRRISDNFNPQEIANTVFENHHDITQIPRELQTQAMAIKDFEIHHDIKRISQRFQTAEMAEQDFAINQDMSRIATRLQTKEMAEQDFAINQDILYIPRQFRTKEMAQTYLENGGKAYDSVAKILFDESANPSLDTAIYYFFHTADLNNIPDSLLTNEFYDKIISLTIINPQMLYNKLTPKLKYAVLKKEFIDIIEHGGSKENLEAKYNAIDINKALKQLEQEDPNLYNKLQQKFEANANTWLQSMIDNILSLETIIENMGLTPKDRKLTLQQKMTFTYQLSKANLQHNLVEIYFFLERYPHYHGEDFTSVLTFFRNSLNFKYQKIKKDGELDLYAEEKYLSQNGHNWLKPFNLNQTFKVENGQPTTILKYLTPTGDTLELTIETARQIIDYLEKNEIPSRNCIVNEAFRRYAKGELDDFVSELKTGLNSKTK